MEKKSNKKTLIIKIIVAIILFCILLIIGIKKAPDYITKEAKDRTNLVINNNNVTKRMKSDVYIDSNEIIYLSLDDVKNYFDKYIDYDKNDNRLITTSDSNIAVIENDEVEINDSKVKINATIIERNDKYYIPFSELAKNVYNVDINYIKSTDRVVIESLDRELVKAQTNKKVKVKYKEKVYSKTLKKLKKDSEIVIISQGEDWTKIRTEDGIVGYIKNKYVSNTNKIRDNVEEIKYVDGKVNLVWDYFSEYASAPNRENENIKGINVVSPTFFYIEKGSDGEVKENVGEDGERYISWAHSNNYKVWAMISNNSYLTTTENILNDYEKRTRLINNIVSLTQKYDIDGINLDFENMNKEDKDVYSRLAIELAPRLKNIGKAFSIDVTAPDGSETWSLCFDRNVLADVADYLIFMGYDQYGAGGSKIGTTAGNNWVETNINKFLNQEEVKKDKLILAMPLYTRLWNEENGEITSKVVNMKDVDQNIPDGVEKKWDDELKQNYVEYVQDDSTYRMWIEDYKSMKVRLDFAKNYELAGIAFWEKDREPEDFWDFVDKEYNN